MADAKKKKILVVDDEQELCLLVKHKLESFGFEVITAHDAPGGFKAVVEQFPDCVLLDIRLERGDGLTLMRQVRAYHCEDLDLQERIRKTPMIILTATGDTMKSLFELEGIRDYMLKPFDSQELKDRILKAISRSKSE